MGKPDSKPLSETSDATESVTLSGVVAQPTALDPAFAPGDLLANRFQIIRFIARGGMGEVYEATDGHLQATHIALKTIRAGVGDGSAARLRFEREVMVSREVRHPNVCPTYDIFRHETEQGSLLFFTMRLLPGEPLSAILARHGPLSPGEALPLLTQMAAGLDAAHAAGIVHRDFKPANVMVDTSQTPPEVAITDFGLSRLYDSVSALSGTGHVAGTMGYIAPELFNGAAPSPASDVYSFGVVIREMTADPPKAWQEAVRRCLDADPAQRPRRAGDAILSLRLDEVVAPSRRPILIWGAASAAVAVGVWSGWTQVDSLLHPLPDQRFVALMAWPPGDDSQNRGLLRNVLEAIEARLVRAETSAHNLLILSSADPRNPTTPAKPADTSGQLGANLVLAANLSTKGSEYRLGLRVLDSVTSRAIRSGSVTTGISALNRLLDDACALAARLLEIPVVHAASRDDNEVAKLPAPALKAFAQAEDFMARPNDAGLDEAIENYQKALDLQPRFAVGYASIARAYLRRYQKGREPAELSLAQRNAELAKQYGPASGKAQFSVALVKYFSGHYAESVEILNSLLRNDPLNAEFSLYKAKALGNSGRRAQEQATLRELQRNRPNYWQAYNELGWALYREGQNEEAKKAFAEAAVVAPRAALPLANLGSLALAAGRREDAADAFRRSIARAPNYVAYSGLGNLDFQNRDYAKALVNYQKAAELRPGEDVNWRNIADCQAKLGDRAAARTAYLKAAEATRAMLANNRKLGRLGMSLAFYLAKADRRAESEEALRQADQNGAEEVASQFLKAQTLAVYGRQDEALALVLELLRRGLQTAEVDLAMDLDRVRGDARYRQAIARRAK